MAVGLGPLPKLHPVPGFALGIASAGIKRPGRKDVVVMRCAEGSRIAGVTTTNAFCAAPVIVTRERMQGEVRYLLTNTGNANAGTGPQGLANARRTCTALAALTGVAEEAVLPFSTGVIGEPLPVEKIEAALQAALDDLDEDHWAQAASGIMTTDTLPKGASRQFQHDGVTVTVTGISKGAGMIRPNMATMLGYIATDAKVAREVLQDLVRDAANKSFNRITIDGDTSTNDCCMLIATGQAALPGMPGCRLCRGSLATDQDRVVRFRPELGAHPRRGWLCRRAEPGCQPDRRVSRRGLHRQPGRACRQLYGRAGRGGHGPRRDHHPDRAGPW